jgi:tRNA threonylcarbamoyladenosine biosynthesis protein TsaE
LYHFDFYRIISEEEAYDIGFEEYIYSNNYCFIEWPEKISELLPDKLIKLKMYLNESGNRFIEVS